MSQADAVRIAERARLVLPLKTARLADVYYYSSLSLCVLDAVFSIGVRYESTEAVVKRYCQFCNLARIRSDRSLLPPKASQEPVSTLVRRIEQNGPRHFATNVVCNSQRTSSRGGILKAEAAALFAKILVAHGVEYLQDLPRYEEGRGLEAALRTVHGQGSGISIGYFWMLAGTDKLVKPDRMVLGFLTETLQRRVEVAEAQRLLSAANDILIGEFPHLTPRLLDYEVWQFQRKEVKPNRDNVLTDRRMRSDDGAVRPSALRLEGYQKAHQPSMVSPSIEGNSKREQAVIGMTSIGQALERAGRELQARHGSNPIPTRELTELAASYAGCSRSSVLPADFAYDRVNRGGVSRAYPMFIGEGLGYWRFVGLGYPYTGPIFWKPVGEAEREVGFSREGRTVFSYDPRKPD